MDSKGIKTITHYITIYDKTLTLKLYSVIDKSLPRVLNTEGIWVESFQRCINKNIIEYVGKKEVNFSPPG